MPETPNGMKGSQFIVSTCGMASSRKMAMAVSLTPTRMRLSFVLSCVPRISRTESKSVMKMAGMLMMPPSAGTCVSAWPGSMPAESSRPVT